MSNVRATPLADDIWNGTGSDSDQNIPVLLVVGEAPPPPPGVQFQFTVYNAPAGAPVRLRQISPFQPGVVPPTYGPPFTEVNGGAPPAGLFGAVAGVITPAGTWTTTINTGAVHGVTIAAQVQIMGVWQWSDNYKIVLVSHAPIVTNGAGVARGFRVYYSDAAGERHTATKLAAGVWCQRIADDLENARAIYEGAGWGFGSGAYALAYSDRRGGGAAKQRVLMFLLDDADLQGVAGVVMPETLPADAGRRSDCNCYMDISMTANALNAWPNVPGAVAPNIISKRCCPYIGHLSNPPRHK